MRNYIMLFMLLLTAASFMTSCEGGSQVSQEELQNLYAKGDSLEQEYQRLQAEYQTAQGTHQQLMAQVEAMETPDSSAMEQLQRHEVMMQGIAANFTKIDELLAAHANFQQEQEGGTLTDEEIMGQMDAMKTDHNEIDSTLGDVSSELETIRNDHENLQQQLTQSETDTEDDTQ